MVEVASSLEQIAHSFKKKAFLLDGFGGKRSQLSGFPRREIVSNGLVLAVVLGIVTLFTFMDRPLPVTKGESITPRTIEFSGYTWSVKKGRQPRAGLIANYFLDWEKKRMG